MSDALDALALQGDVQIVYNPEVVRGKMAHGVSGFFSAASALKHLLEGTGLDVKMAGERSFVVVQGVSPESVGRQPSVTPGGRPPYTLDTITVSGALISNAQIQTATPTFTMTAEEINARGFSSLEEALQSSVLALGPTQGPQYSFSFTQGAQTVNFLGLGPGFTLILLDGKPLANFGMLYNGTYNFNNLANIPMSWIDHIDIMPGGGSSIYGSQAIAGVINIVTRQRMEGGEVSLHANRFTGSGGEGQGGDISFGQRYGRFTVLGGLAFDRSAPIWGYQRGSITHNANQDRAAASQAVVVDFGGIRAFNGRAVGYLSPPAGCDRGLFGGSTALVNPPSTRTHGQYCGALIQNFSTLADEGRTYDGLLKVKYDVNESTRLYSDMLVDWQEQRWMAGVHRWKSSNLPGLGLVDADTGHVLLLERYFAPEEMPGGIRGQMQRQHDLLYQFDVGANGRFSNPDWSWDIYYLRSGDRTTIVDYDPITARVNQFFTREILGPVVGVDPATGFRSYRPDYAAFFRRITPAQYASFIEPVSDLSQSWINNTRASISNDRLFHLPGGDAGMAALVEGGNEAWYQPINPLYLDGSVYDRTAASGGGRRSHLASAMELNLPLLQRLTADLSVRYDRYEVGRGGSSQKVTYKAGLEWRALDALLIRGNYATVFKAPDMSSLFLGPTSSYQHVTDYYICALQHSRDCNGYSQSVRTTISANPFLRPETAKTWTYGIVWSPGGNLSLSLDYLHIAIRNEVTFPDGNSLIRHEALCRLGEVDPSSSECRALTDPINGQVRRASRADPAYVPGEITGITAYYANQADEVTGSIIASARYRFVWHGVGRFVAQMDYGDMLKHTYRMGPGGQMLSRLSDPQSSFDFKSVLSGSLSWASQDGRWSGTLYGHRYGPTPNAKAINHGLTAAGAGRTSPWITYDWSMAYMPTSDLKLSLLINNVTDKMPAKDPTYSAFPYFNVDSYNVYGREIMLQVKWLFGRHTH
ncbi:TonB-dependent receptor [Dyella sp. OK004]|uniref:TonB-dependent receptor n=1 Tax=Dyella sp. OK004 TaxID=1855292 RepID=UPI0015A6FD4D|nr:TonB-dependent receptor [Dyella sp. OK004]